MSGKVLQISRDLRSGRRAPLLIAAGLLMLGAATWWPTLPAVTAMTLIVLGATWVTVERFRGKPLLVPVLFMHVAIYSGLYALFAGSVLYAAARANSGMGLSAAIDLVVSLGPMAAVLSVLADAVRGIPTAE